MIPAEFRKTAQVPATTSAGAATADITPPPGYPTGGDGMAGALARGAWTRLSARAFFFEEGGRRLLLVSCDLFLVPEALPIELASRVADLGIAPHEIVVAATHTHQGPGNYGSAAVYNEFGSAYMGFSRPLFDFLAARVAEAARAAVRDARTNDGDVRVVHRAGRGPDVFLNRAPEPFLLNPDRDALMEAWNPGAVGPAGCVAKRKDGEPETAWRLEGCPRLRAIDPTLHALDVRRGGRLVAELLFVPIHPTVMRADASFYGGDIATALTRGRERRYAARGENVVVGFFNGAEGDVVARRTTRDVRDVIGIARDLDAAVGSLPEVAEGPLTLEVLRADADPSEPCDAPLATRPEFGAATLGGGEGDRTALYALGWKEGLFGHGDIGQGPKLGGLDSSLVRELRLTNDLAPPWKFPRFLPVSYARIGPLELATVPVELSTTSGWSLRQALSDDPRSVAVVGLANGYSSYAANEHEYLAQDYVGASTVWGPNEARYLRCVAARLKRDRPAPPRRSWSTLFSPGAPPVKSFGPRFLGDSSPDALTGSFAALPDGTGRPARDLPAFAWIEDVRGLRRRGVDPDLETARRRTVRILERTASGDWRPREGRGGDWLDEGPDDDTGFNLLTILIDGRATTRRTWSATWIRPLHAAPPVGTFRFEVALEGTPATCMSEPFTLPAAAAVPMNAATCVLSPRRSR